MRRCGGIPRRPTRGQGGFDNKLDELGALDAIEACGMYVDRAMYNMKKAVQNFFRELLELMFNAAALVVDTLRTFFLIVLSILGPISFAISCWDGFQASLSQWFVRYISIYLWLPVSDLFSSVLARIQTLMLQKDIEQLSDPNFIPDSSNAVISRFLSSASSGISPSRPWRTGSCRPEEVPETTERT